MIRVTDPEALTTTIIVTLGVAMIVVGIRVWLLQRARAGVHRDLRQQAERLKALLAACRALAGSFTPATPADARTLEEALTEIVLFGSVSQVRLAAQAATVLCRGELPDCQALVDDLRAELRSLLGLDALPADLDLPPAGPSRARAVARRAASALGSGADEAS